MFPARFFCRRFFPARYWPKVGVTVSADPIVLELVGIGEPTLVLAGVAPEATTALSGSLDNVLDLSGE